MEILNEKLGKPRLEDRQAPIGVNPEAKFSEILFSIRWHEFFPHAMTPEGYRLELSNYDECIDFSKIHHEELFGIGKDSPFIWIEFSEKKRIYYEKMVDFFRITHQGKLIGVHCGAPSDWGSYYLRHSMILKDHQGRGLYQQLLQYTFAILQNHGVQRVEGDIVVKNTKNMQLFQKLGFHMNGFNVSERWGAMVHLTKHLDPRYQSVFERQFCHGFENNK